MYELMRGSLLISGKIKLYNLKYRNWSKPKLGIEIIQKNNYSNIILNSGHFYILKYYRGPQRAYAYMDYTYEHFTNGQ